MAVHKGHDSVVEALIKAGAKQTIAIRLRRASLSFFSILVSSPSFVFQKTRDFYDRLSYESLVVISASMAITVASIAISQRRAGASILAAAVPALAAAVPGCGICHEAFSSKTTIAAASQCGHIFCEPCLKAITAAVCPLCKNNLAIQRLYFTLVD
ncbi:MAG: hypothetical protein KA436_10475 [Oligoflexales bacterium]|nr:hypothetical protein [Oligoflexales bacterium]